MKYALIAIIGCVIGGGVVSLVAFDSNKRDVKADREYLQHVSENYRIYALPLPESADFCAESAPLQMWDVAEKLDRELLVNSYWHSNTLLAIKRSARWFPLIEKVLKEEGVPDDFKYLALVESNFTNATSPAGAVGYWQFLAETATEFGLEVNDEVDERYHVEKSTRAACKYFKQAYNKLGSWSLAAASYNMGMLGVQKQMDRQKQNNYYELLLNEETSRYVFRILSMKEIVNNTDKYGFVIRPSDIYAPIDSKEVTITGAVEDFAIWCQEYGVSYKDFKLLNPWLRQAYLKNKSGKTYVVKIPD
ncbi:MAG: lytic transglycosylase domain-containing protein [Flavobacteriales bacterium]